MTAENYETDVETLSRESKAPATTEADDVATLSDRTLTAEQRFARLCENTPYFRIEHALMRISVNVAAFRSLLHWREDVNLRLDEADRRVAHAIRALEGFSTAYMRLKTGARHTAFTNEMRRIRSVLEFGGNTRVQDSEKTIAGLYASVREQLGHIRDEATIDPKDVARIEEELRGIAGLHKTLHSVLVAELPRVAAPMAVGTLLDNEAWAHLMVTIRASHEAEKPRILAEAMAALVADMDRTTRQITKVGTRTRANGATESEAAAAHRRGCALQASLQVMRKRLVALSAAFYKHRAKQAAALAAATKSVHDTMSHAAIDVETAQSVNAFRHRHPVKRELDDILGLDASLDSGRGANPHQGYSMAAIMRHFKDNYVERITDSGKANPA